MDATATTKTAQDIVARSTARRVARNRRGFPWRVLYFAIAVLGAAFMILPVFWMLSEALKPQGQVLSIPPVLWPATPYWNSFSDAVTSASLPTSVLNAIKNSLIITLIPMIGDVGSAAVVAYAFARLRAPGSNLLFLIVIGTIMIPFEVTVLPQFILFNQLHWIDSFLPLIVPPFFGNAFNIFLLRQFFRGIPRELDEAAELDGLGYLGILWRVILPLSKPALAAVAVFSFVYHWNDFFYPLIYLNSPENYPVPYLLQQFTGAYGYDQWNLVFALGLISAVPSLALFFIAQRYFIQGIVVSGVNG